MAYLSTQIETPTVTAPTAPTLNAYETPDVDTVKTVADTSNMQYQAPASNFTEHNLNTGLLEYDPTKADNLTFDGKEINADAVGANINQTTPSFANSSNYLSDGAFVENRISGLLSDDNDLNKAVKAKALADSNARGLANSSMGVTAGQTALVNNALQIATPDATTQATADLSRQTADYTAQGKVQDANIQSSLAQQTAAINSALQSQLAGNEWDSTKQKAVIQGELNSQNANIAGAQTDQAAAYAYDAKNQTGLLEGAQAEQQGKINAELSSMESVSAQNIEILKNKLESANNTTQEQNAAIIEAYQQQQENFRTTLNNSYSVAVSQAQLNSTQREALGSYMTEMANNYEISIQNVLLDANLTAESKNSAIAKINALFNQDMDNIASIFGADYSATNTGADYVQTEAD